MECVQCAAIMDEYENVTSEYKQKQGVPKRPGWICPVCGLITWECHQGTVIPSTKGVILDGIHFTTGK